MGESKEMSKDEIISGLRKVILSLQTRLAGYEGQKIVRDIYDEGRTIPIGQNPNPIEADILRHTESDDPDLRFGGNIAFLPFSYRLVPLRGLTKVAGVMREGELKGRANEGWRSAPVEEHLNHAMAHIVAYLEGRHHHHHLANAGCRILMALDMDCREVDPVPAQKGPQYGRGETHGSIYSGESLGKAVKEMVGKVPPIIHL
jgi:hypothetical protein